MGITIQKITVKCECGSDYGSCSKTNAFYLKYNRAADIGELLHRPHIEDCGATESLGHFTDADISAIIKLLSTNETEELNDNEKTHLREVNE